jgi:hypothetical protein
MASGQVSTGGMGEVDSKLRHFTDLVSFARSFSVIFQVRNIQCIDQAFAIV